VLYSAPYTKTGTLTVAFGDLWARIRGGERVGVTTADGKTVTGLFQTISPDDVQISVNDQLRVFTSADVIRVFRRDDPISDGAAIGFGLGAISGLGTGDSLGVKAGMMLLAGGFYAAIGAAIDGMIPGTQTIFDREGRANKVTLRVSPLVAPHAQGLRLNFGF
jgi:hypothetical protein